jgi:signal transduction histidine kinase
METTSVDRLAGTNPLARQLLTHPHLLVFLVDASGQLIGSSPQVQSQFVGSDPLQRPQYFMQLIHPQNLNSLRSGLSTPIHEPVPFSVVVEWLAEAGPQRNGVQLLRVDGMYVPVQLHVSPLPDSDDLFLIFAQNLELQVLAESQLNRRDLQLKAQLAAKTQVVESELMRSDDSSLVISVLVEVIALTLDVERVSVWFYTTDRNSLQCVTLFMKSRDEHTRLQELNREQHPKFLGLLEAVGALRVSDVMAHPELTELVSTYFKPNLIRSLLAQPIRLRGQVHGYLFLSQPQSSREWTYEDLIFTSNMADLISLSIESERRHQLEERLAETPAPSSNAATSSAEGSSQEQSKLLHTEKMATLGTLIAGVAHEINTPLGAINASGSNLSKSLPQVLNKIPSFFKALAPELEPLFYNLVERSLNFSGTLSSREERQYRKQVSELLKEKNIPGASNLSKDLVKVGIVEDIDEFIPIFMQPNADEIIDMAYSIGRLRVNIDNIQTAVNKTQKIVFALKSYSRRNSFDEPELANIVQNIETVLTIYHNQLKYGIEVSRDFEPNLPNLRCYADELMQVWTNIIHNAIQAMNGKGSLHLEARQIGGDIVVRITDSGPGIPEHILSRIFDAFFTTKPEGEGSGLGLDISRRIIEKHQGRIEVDTEPGRTTFSIFLPIDNGLEKSKMEGSADAISEIQASN